MGAQLNIKSEDAYRLASRLAELTGESLTSVVTRALRAELEREERARDHEERSAPRQRDHGGHPRTSARSVAEFESRLAVRRETDCRE